MSEVSSDRTTMTEAGAVVGAAVRLEAHAVTRTNLSVQHLLAAAHFAKRVASVEEAHMPGSFGAFFDELLWYSSACVFSCVAGLEAYANELFVDRAQHFAELRPEIADRLWDLFEQKPTLEKFDMALLLKQKPALDRGSRPTQDVAGLVLLRNALTHFKPEWDDEQAAHARISRQLANRFAPSPFLAEPELLFPRRWASRGCTRWAVDACVDFLLAFETLAGVPAKVAMFADRLRP